MTHKKRTSDRRPIAYSAVGLTLASSLLLAACGSSQDAQRSAADDGPPNLSSLSQAEKEAVGISNQGQYYPVGQCNFHSATNHATNSNTIYDYCNIVTATGTVGWNSEGNIGPLALEISVPSGTGLPSNNVAYDSNPVVWQPTKASSSATGGQATVITSQATEGDGTTTYPYGGALASKKVANSLDIGSWWGRIAGCSNTEYLLCSYEGISQTAPNGGQTLNIVNFRTFPIRIEFVSLVNEEFSIDNESFSGLLEEDLTGTAGSTSKLQPQTNLEMGPGVIRAGYRSSQQSFTYKAQLDGANGTQGEVSLSFPAAPTEVDPGPLARGSGCEVYQKAAGASGRDCYVKISRGSYDRVRIYITDGSSS